MSVSIHDLMDLGSGRLNDFDTIHIFQLHVHSLPYPISPSVNCVNKITTEPSD
jgi:hypothetical protein